MRLMKSVLIFLIVTATFAGAIYTIHTRNLIPHDLFGGMPYQATNWITNQVDSLLAQYQPAISHIQTVQQDAGTVLGDFIQINEKDQDKKLHERTLELAQYTYCKQVVEQWEKTPEKNP
jgi:hypothetical protein